MREQVRQIPGDLGARLRALRERYPTLAITTEIIHQSDRLITFRATITIEALVRAQGHAAQRAEPTGAFVTATETMAVEQALLLGGFVSPDQGGQAAAALEQAPSSPPQVSPLAARAAADQEPSSSAPITEPILTANETAEDNEPSAAAVQTVLPAAITNAADEANAANPEGDAAAADTTPPVPSRPKRDRQAERARAKARAASAQLPSDRQEPPAASAETSTLVDEANGTASVEDTAAPAALSTDIPAPVDEPTRVEMAEPTPARETAPVAEPTIDEVVSIQPTPATSAAEEPAPAPEPAPTPAPEPDAVAVTPTPPATPRKSRTRAVATAPAAAIPVAPATADTPPTREALREAWQVGRPIPAWWPQNRPLVNQPIGKTRVGRLRTLALDEEISTSLLDTYSTLLFGVPIAGLDQTQSLILEERLNPAYPSPLEELRVRRIIHPLAVSDEMTITEEQPFFVRWSDVPPVAEAPEPPPPPTITWRERGKKGGGRRR